MDPLSRPVVTSYKLPIVTTVLFVTVFAVLQLVTDRQTDGRNWSSKRRHFALSASATRNWSSTTFTVPE